MPIRREIQEAFADAHRRVLIDTITGHASVTLADLGRLARRTFGGVLGDITVGELIGPTAERASVHRGVGPATPADTRTPAARKRYDGALESALGSNRAWMNAQQLRAIAGGTPLQARKALNRLIVSGSIEFRGKARATAYRAI